MPHIIELPAKPYLYDDPRFIYNEACLSYNGVFDEQCLIDLRFPPKPEGKSTSYKSSNLDYDEKKCRAVLDVDIEIALSKINNYDIDDKKHIKKYHMDYGPIEVSLDRIKHKEEDLQLNMRTLGSSIVVPKICVGDRRFKQYPINISVSSSLGHIKKPKIIFKTESLKKK